MPSSWNDFVKFFLLLPLGMGQIFSSAQDTLTSPLGAGAKLFISGCGHYGFLVAHHQNMDYLIKSHVPAGELNFILQTNGEKHWEQVYKHPEKGIGFYFAGLGNPEELGQAMGIFPFVNFPVSSGKKFKLYLRAGDGIGIFTRPYDRISNHKNNIIGSRINGFVNLRLNSVFFPWKNIRMETGIGLTHLSNGAWSVPNLGINIATINFGIGFKAKEIKPVKKTETGSAPQVFFPKYFFTLIAAAGVNETNPPDGEKYAAYSLIASQWKTVSEKSRFCLGGDLFYEMANIARAKRDTIFDTSNKLNNLQAGIRFGYELAAGKFSLPLEMGAYLFSKITSDGPLYHRIGVRYYANKHLIINFTLRTHWATAENLELGIGYRF